MKTDFKKTVPSYTAAAGTFDIVDVAPHHYLMVDGSGDPNTSQEYADAIGALFPVAYSIKFASKTGLGMDYVVTPLEALWWASDMESFTASRDKTQWKWTAMIMIPPWIDRKMFDAAVSAVSAKKTLPGLPKVRLESLDEGLCVQTLHIGPYDDEASTLAELHEVFIPGNGLIMTGKHHEVYLSDVRRVAPNKLRTILRQPVMRRNDSA